MRRQLRLLGATCVIAFAAVAHAQTQIVPDSLVRTHHQVVVDGKTLKYTATTGRLPIINNDAGEPHGYMFFVAYTLDRGPNDPVRPLTFVWNGGPGSPASQVHLMGFGPMRVKTGDTYPTSPPLSVNTTLEPNQETWLDFTDLVFVDPIGTGYSRPTKPEYGKEFYNTVGDAESVAEFIRIYRQRTDAFNAPLFLAGESYGTIRAQQVAEALERRRTTVSGVALISGGIDLGQKVPQAMKEAMAVPWFTATAWYHKKLPADLQSGTEQAAIDKATQWARDVYAPALERLDSLTLEQRNTILQQLVRFAGITPSAIDFSTMTIPVEKFTDYLLRDQGLDLGRYDSRMVAPRDVTKRPWTTNIDPSLRPVLDMMQGTSPTLLRYLRNDLKYRTDLVYRGPFGGAYPAPEMPAGDWMTVQWNHGSSLADVPAYDTPPGVPPGAIPMIPPLLRAMQDNPSMRILVMRGMYDMGGCATEPRLESAATSLTISYIDPALRKRVAFACYVGGHMMYTDKTSRQQMKRDMRELVREGSASVSASTVTP
jgi:carboxypeptidase C (cathepsin A)